MKDENDLNSTHGSKGKTQEKWIKGENPGKMDQRGKPRN
jgi:hypothetical protein